MNKKENDQIIAIVGKENISELEGNPIILVGGMPKIIELHKNHEAQCKIGGQVTQLQTDNEALTQELEELKKLPEASPEEIENLTQEIKDLNEKNLTLGKTIDELNDDLENAHEPEPDPICVVIPYVKEFAQGNELKHALRGWGENFKENFKVVIIGDKEDWMSDDIIHIPHTRIGNNPPLDIVDKYKKILESDEVSEEFIWTNDDIYPINPIFMHDIRVLKAVGKLENAKLGGTLYQKNKKRTLETLQKLKVSTFDYSTHLPVVYEKSKLDELIKEYNLDKKAQLIQSLYHNVYFNGIRPHILHLKKDIWKIAVYRKNPDMLLVGRCMHTHRFFNHSQTGYIKEVKALLKKRFSKKSRFEN